MSRQTLLAGPSFNPNAPRNVIIAIFAVVIFLVFFITLWLLVWYPNATTFDFMQTERLSFTSFTFPSNDSVVIGVINTREPPYDLRIAQVRIDDNTKTASYGGNIGSDGTLQGGEGGTITIDNWNWTAGEKYAFSVVTVKGYQFIYQTIAGENISITIPAAPIDYLPILFLGSPIAIIGAASILVIYNRKHANNQLLKKAIILAAVITVFLILSILITVWMSRLTFAIVSFGLG